MKIMQAWGMTETSPLGAVARPPAEAEGEEHWRYRTATGRIVPLVDVRLMGDDGEVPWDGESTGEVEVRGPWIARDYYEDPIWRRQVPRRLAAHGRHRLDRPAGIPADHRPREGPDQVRRRVDLLGGARERAHVPSRRDGGGGDRQAGRALDRAPAGLRRLPGGRRTPRRRSCARTSSRWSRSGGCRTNTRSSRRSRRRAWASSTRRCSAAQLAEGALDTAPAETAQPAK